MLFRKKRKSTAERTGVLRGKAQSALNKLNTYGTLIVVCPGFFTEITPP